MSAEQALTAYAECFAALTPERVDELCRLVSDDVHFRDPFNDLHGREAMRHLLMDMFARAGRPDFHVDDICWHAASATGWLRWHFRAELPVIGTLAVEGCSRVQVNAQGLITEHLDYWDSAPVYLKLPLIGRFLQRVRRRIAAE
ncbi:nuclear transport factor 2 family protein [Marinobacterium weihaiense]|uniref:Nuclear transport factor 2 family protein n=1 Tax=Marinobacterium weihaiense TaxID=2851016 RepID=A0ABS6MA24_9GAMM|nr:nuclear transport factor 2 family protein [Marinobacterium weihaiense]MBV0933015.1 nuclear transport factor 2 family protein [Marinobacterium weihaiense]